MAGACAQPSEVTATRDVRYREGRIDDKLVDGANAGHAGEPSFPTRSSIAKKSGPTQNPLHRSQLNEYRRPPESEGQPGSAPKLAQQARRGSRDVRRPSVLTLGMTRERWSILHRQ